MGTHLKFSTTFHPQTDGQTEVTNWSFGTLLGVLFKKCVTGWDELLPHAKFSFNRAPSKATQLSPFQVVDGYNPRTPLDFTPIPTPTKFSWEAEKRAKKIKETSMHKSGRGLKGLILKPCNKPTNTIRRSIFCQETWYESTWGRRGSQANTNRRSSQGHMAPLKFWRRLALLLIKWTYPVSMVS